MLFKDRHDAGSRLAERLAREDLEAPVVLGLPRGGVPVAAVVASALEAPLDAFVARKVGAPGHPEFGIGAIAEGSDEIVVSESATRVGVSGEQLTQLAEQERPELERRVRMYRGDDPIPPLHGRDVVLVDDGLATGVTAEAALGSLRRHHPRRLVLAVPVCAPDTARRLADLADAVVCLAAPQGFRAVGEWYEQFEQTTDQEVLAALGRTAGDPVHAGAARQRAVAVEVEGAGLLHGDLTVPAHASAVVLFAHGSGSGSQSPRNRAVAGAFHRRGLATMLVDLLTEEERRGDDRARQLAFDIDLLTRRLHAASKWLHREPATADLPLGCFGASTGAAAALVAAAESSPVLRAVVCRGGRTDLAGAVLSRVTIPILLVVGGDDESVLALNRESLPQLGGEHRLEIVAGATHLFEEPGALEVVTRLAGDWFTRWLGGAPNEAASVRA